MNRTHKIYLHARPIVAMAKGPKALKHIGTIQIEWANAQAKGIDAKRLIDAVEILRKIRSRCGMIENKSELEKAQT